MTPAPRFISWNCYPQIDLPKTAVPVDRVLPICRCFRTLQTLTQDTTYGVNPQFPQHGYQLYPGSETQAPRIISPFARLWSPTRMVPSNVVNSVSLRYGGPLTILMGEARPHLGWRPSNLILAMLLRWSRQGLGYDHTGSWRVRNIAHNQHSFRRQRQQCNTCNSGQLTITKVTRWFGQRVGSQKRDTTSTAFVSHRTFPRA